MKIYRYPSKTAESRVAKIIDRGLSLPAKEVRSVSRILADVRKRGDAALVEYTSRFDAPDMTADALKVTKNEIDDAVKSVDRAFMRSLNRAIGQITSFHEKQREQSWFTTERPGVFLGQMVRTVEGAGIYAPGGQGGKTPLVSSVLMGAIPAKVAGVDRIVLVSPPMKNGRINAHILAAARKIGIMEIYKLGSAWAIAALAYGTETIAPVNVIAGPGNLYVTIAKKLVSGTVGIDMIAGPSEILVIADRTADPDCVAADLLSQAEHDVLASSILITDSRETAKAVVLAVDEQLAHLARKEIARKSLEKFGAILVVDGITEAVSLANRMAPEHLELQVADPFTLLGGIRNAGAVFMGHHTPEPVGDYIAGPNHVLPTAGTARFSSALSVEHFLKKTSLIHYSRAALKREAVDIMRLAEIEGLGAHANAVRCRLKKKRGAFHGRNQ